MENIRELMCGVGFAAHSARRGEKAERGLCRGIIKGHFDCSYELISDVDKENISRDDFIKWQRAVARIFHLKEFSLRICRAGSDKSVNSDMKHEAEEYAMKAVGEIFVNSLRKLDIVGRLGEVNVHNYECRI